MLWLMTVLVVAFALSPYYIGSIGSALTRRPAPGATAPAQSTGRTDALETVTVQVEGMDCASCEIPIRAALEKTAGVREAEVSFQRGEAHVTFDPQQTNAQRIKSAIESTGYRAR
jgi:copper chaperone CopZ